MMLNKFGQLLIKVLKNPHKALGKLYGYFLISYYLPSDIFRVILRCFRNRTQILLFVENYQGWIRMRYVHKYFRDVLKYEVIVFVAPLQDSRLKWPLQKKCDEIVANIISEGVLPASGVKNNKCVRIEKFMPDVIFLANPYDCLRNSIYSSAWLSKFSDIAHITYGYTLSNTPISSCDIDFFDYCMRIYNDSTYMMEEFVKNRGKDWANERCLLSGQPQIEAFYDQNCAVSNYWPRQDQKGIKKVIIAPHHTIKNNVHKGDFAEGYSSFLEFRNTYLKLPELFPNIDFVIRYHPLMLFQLKEFNAMTQEEIKEFLDQFKSFPNADIDEDFPDYIAAFKSADVLITDGVSFLAEFLTSTKPIIQTQRQGKPEFNAFGKKITECNYMVYTEKELIDNITKLVIQDEDPLYDERIKVVNDNIFFPKGGIGKFIGEDIKRFLTNKNGYRCG